MYIEGGRVADPGVESLSKTAQCTVIRQEPDCAMGSSPAVESAQRGTVSLGMQHMQPQSRKPKDAVVDCTPPWYRMSLDGAEQFRPV